ncbi:MAG TPA: hypothetical protein VGX23_07295 [Actinocrinis sp.]|nr:hypothetical protein [Actinocrinis sp.]
MNGVTGGIANPGTCGAGAADGVLADQGITSYGSVALVWQTASGISTEIYYHYVNQNPPDAATMLHMADTVK